MKKLRLCFLWHMHQPYYKNDPDGRYHLPWVFLHAVKDYYELPAYHKVYPKIKATYNIVPSVALQLKDYADGSADDDMLRLMKKEPALLNEEEKDTLLSQLFMANVPNMIRPLKRFYEFHLRKSSINMFEHPHKGFSDEEITELSVLYLLSWCGEFTREESPLILKLIEKQKGYSREELFALLNELESFVGKIIPLYKELVEQNKIEVSATPFYHPILPLLIDINSAKEAYRDITMPSVREISLLKDAEHHVAAAVKSHTEDFGKAPTGMWPAEGSISTKAAEIFAKNGIKWIASDEDVLGNSIKKNMSDPKNRETLYKRNYIQTAEGKINIFFRDKVLSDLIGFTYSGWNAEEAASDFVSRLKKIYDHSTDSPLVPVILDGENAWEYYPENAKDFFNALYDLLSKTEWIETCTMNEAVNIEEIPENRIEKITAGSWIYGNFTTWLGHSEKNEGWRHLTAAADTLQKNSDHPNYAKAKQELYIAEGSDWFWWYGDDHFSLQSDIFDKLFRTHLSNIYTALGIEIPSELMLPIKKTYRTGDIRKPACLITPYPDGVVTSFYEWLGSGIFDLKFDSGAMHSSGTMLEKLYYGYDANMVYLRLDGEISHSLSGQYEVEIEITTYEKKIFILPLSDTAGDTLGKETPKGSIILYGAGKIFEAAIPFSELFKSGRGKLFVSFRIRKDGDIIEKSPLYNLVEIDTSSDFDDDWMV